MILNKESIEGNIKKIDTNGFKMTIAGLGLLVICSGSLMLAETNNKKYDYSPDKSYYSQQLEEMFDVELTQDQKLLTSKLEDFSNLLFDYENASHDEKKEVLSQIKDASFELEDISFQRVKEEVANEHGGVWSDYKIFNAESGGAIDWMARREVVVNHIQEVESFSLSGQQSHMVDKIDALQNSRSYLDSGSERDVKLFINSYKNLIRQNSKFTVNQAKQSK